MWPMADSVADRRREALHAEETDQTSDPACPRAAAALARASSTGQRRRRRKLADTARESDSRSAPSPTNPATATTPVQRKTRIPHSQYARMWFVVPAGVKARLPAAAKARLPAGANARDSTRASPRA